MVSCTQTSENQDSENSDIQVEQRGSIDSTVQLSSPTDIRIEFKLDQRLTRAVYMGDRWVWPSKFTPAIQQGKTCTVQAKAYGLYAGRIKITISPKWIPQDPEMVTVSPNEGHQISIIVKRAGKSTLTVSAQGYSKVLLIKAEQRKNALQVEILQKMKEAGEG